MKSHKLSCLNKRFVLDMFSWNNENDWSLDFKEPLISLMVRRDKTFLVCEAFTILYVLLNPQFLGLDVWDQGVSRVGPVCLLAVGGFLAVFGAPWFLLHHPHLCLHLHMAFSVCVDVCVCVHLCLLKILYYYYFGVVPVACRILVSWPGIKPMSPAMEAQSPKHWVTRKLPPFPTPPL